MAWVKKNATTRIAVEIRTYKKVTFLDIREYYINSDSPDERIEFLPTKKGITVPLESLSEFMDALHRVVGEHEEATA